MKSKLIWLLVISLTFSFVGCVPENGQPDTTTAPLPDAASVYAQAAQEAGALKDMALMISATETITTGDEIYTQHTRQTLLYNDYGTEKMVAHQSETRSYGDYQVAISTAFRDGISYFNVDSGKFQCQMTAADYCQMYAPAVLFNADLYESIESTTDGMTSTFTFSNPTALEDWAAPEGAVLLNAYGNAILDSTNHLIESNYSVRYQHEGRTFTKTVSVELNPAKPTITFPDTQQYMQLELPEAPILMEQAVGYLMQTQRATSVTTEKITCEVFGDTRTQITVLNMHSDDTGLSARLDISTTLENANRVDESSQQMQSIRYIDEEYTTVVDGQTASRKDITPEQMHTYCQDYLLSTILMTKYINSIQVTQDTKEYKISFTAGEEMAKLMRENACQTLYGDPTLLDLLADSYKTSVMSGYITIDTKTLIPTSSGITYTGIHQVNGVSYQLIFETSQTYIIPSDTAYDTIRA